MVDLSLGRAHVVSSCDVHLVMARTRIKTASEIALETDEAEALIIAGARLKEARARANAQVLGTRLSGFVDITKRTGLVGSAQSEVSEPRGQDDTNRASQSA